MDRNLLNKMENACSNCMFFCLPFARSTCITYGVREMPNSVESVPASSTGCTVKPSSFNQLTNWFWQVLQIKPANV